MPSLAVDVTEGQLLEAVPTCDSGLLSLVPGWQSRDTAVPWLLLLQIKGFSFAFLMMMDCGPL